MIKKIPLAGNVGVAGRMGDYYRMNKCALGNEL
jgi:hypothetical protein